MKPWANSMAPAISSSLTSRDPASIMVMESLDPQTTTSIRLVSSWGKVGFSTYWPSTWPIRTAAMGPRNGMSEMERADEAPIIPKMSASFSWSAEITEHTTWTSLRKSWGNSGRIGRSIIRADNISLSRGLPSRLKNPPGIRPAA